jgi:8-hydroxy-5-deazaflavin:NADPH oxidoreductase
MKLAIIGAGNVGGVLGQGWAGTGHTIVYGVPSPDGPKYARVAQAAGNAKVTTVADAVGDADAVVLATPWNAVPTALAACGDFAGRPLLDATNPLRFGEAGLELAIGFSTSGGEYVASLAKGAAVVKTMNQVGFAVMADAGNYTAPPVMFAAGDDAGAKQLALKLVAELGFDAIDAGPLKIARLLEPLAMLWIDQVMVHGAPGDSAFAFLRRQQQEGNVRAQLLQPDDGQLTT